MLRRHTGVHGLTGVCLALLATVTAGLASASVPVGTAGNPPAEYADLYALLAGKLREANTLLVARGDAPRDVTFAAELLAANGNQGEVLLRPQQMRAVEVYLDRMQVAGARGVKVGIKYPLLVDRFPRSAEYAAFFRRVAEEARRRNLRLLVQMTALFREPAFSQVPIEGYYATLTFDRYKAEKRQMAETIVREIRPDFLTIENEPQTASANTGLRITVAAFAELIRHVTDGLDRDGVRLGAGAGTWDDAAYVEALARIPGLDYVDLHLYPVNRDFLTDRPLRMAEIARRAGKRIVIGETWLYKARDRELAGAPVAAAPMLFARDVYAFWEPLDVEFIATMGRLSRAVGSDLTSFFWSRHFYGYVDYSEATSRLQPAQLFQLANRAAVANMTADPPRLTATGQAFRRLSTGGR
jgi:hypothetical protein